jgi:enoyl-CoA hydratase
MAEINPRQGQRADIASSWYTFALPMTTYETILFEQAEGIATLTLNRPDKLNALNERLLIEVHGVLLNLSRDSSVRALIVTGAGKAFAAGADIPVMTGMSTAMAKAFADSGHAIADTLESAPFPCIAAVNGFALGGGCELAMACDFIYASEHAKFGQPEVGLGVIPGFGGTQRLARRVGLGRARELCYTGDTIGAEEALRIGLVNAVCPAADLIPRVLGVAKKIAAKGPLAIAQCKRVIGRGADLPLERANELEGQAFALLFGTTDQREGMKAFAEKRPARFTGR